MGNTNRKPFSISDALFSKSQPKCLVALMRYWRTANSARRFLQQEFPVNIASEKELWGRFRGQIAFETILLLKQWEMPQFRHVKETLRFRTFA